MALLLTRPPHVSNTFFFLRHIFAPFLPYLACSGAFSQPGQFLAKISHLMHQCKLRSSATFRIYTTPQRAWLAWFWTAVDCHGKLLYFTVNLKRSTCLEFLWSMSLAPIILKDIFIISASIYSEVLSINNCRQFGEIFSNLELIPVLTGGGRGWRPSSCKPCLSFLS